MGKKTDKRTKKLHDWQEENRKPTPEELRKTLKRTFGTSHWKPPKKKKETKR